MRYLAINVNYKMDMDWYHRCDSVVDCFQYFDNLGIGDGKRTAIYDIEAKEFLWIDDDSLGNMDRLEGIVDEAIQKAARN